MMVSFPEFFFARIEKNKVLFPKFQGRKVEKEPKVENLKNEELGSGKHKGTKFPVQPLRRKSFSTHYFT